MIGPSLPPYTVASRLSAP